LGPSGANQIGQYLPLATKSTQSFAGKSTDVYKLGVAQFAEQMHPDLPGPTHFWGYYDLATGDHKYLAGVIVANRGTPVLLNVTNQLPNATLIPTDGTLPTLVKLVRQLPANRIATHLHGGFTPWFSDGTPFQWFDPTGLTGESFMNVPGTNPSAGTATYWYPMDQSARLVWYHDHAVGITRTNAYAGIALRHHPQHLLLRLRHDRRRHQRQGQRKHCGSEPTPRRDRHGTFLYVVAFCCLRVLQHWRRNARASEPGSRSPTEQRCCGVWAIGRVKTMGASPKSPSTTWEWLLYPGAQSPGQRNLITVLGRPQWSEPARSSKRAKPGSNRTFAIQFQHVVSRATAH